MRRGVGACGAPDCTRGHPAHWTRRRYDCAQFLAVAAGAQHGPLGQPCTAAEPPSSPSVAPRVHVRETRGMRATHQLQPPRRARSQRSPSVSATRDEHDAAGAKRPVRQSRRKRNAALNATRKKRDRPTCSPGGCSMHKARRFLRCVPSPAPFLDSSSLPCRAQRVHLARRVPLSHHVESP